MDNISRYEINRQVRVTLTKHSVDYDLIECSAIGHTVYLSGKLLTSSHHELTTSGLEEPCRELARIPGVKNMQFDLENWTISSSGYAWQFIKKKKGVPRYSFADSSEHNASADYAIPLKNSEKISDVVKDLREKKKKKQ
jgi:hypothetical protein